MPVALAATIASLYRERSPFLSAVEYVRYHLFSYVRADAIAISVGC